MSDAMSDTVSETMSDTSAAKEVNLVQERLLQQIDAATSGSQASFCCAGRVSIKQEKDSPLGNNTLDTTDSQLIADPIAIRWDCRDGKTCNKLKLPPDSYDANATDQGALQDLLNDCAPATFGKHDKEVLDESYRKAIKLDVDQFSTNFNPHDVGIIATIAQTLLPGMTVPKTSDGDRAIVENLGVIAELYKLNVYLAPSGKFKAHVDTPRGATQFGSLVVCLPCHHQGGQLRVAHKTRSGNHEMVYDWSDQETEINWAAFYSDCEHEVYEVTEGHRITLTYNLYAHEQLGGILRNPATVNRESFTFYRCVKEALVSPNFFPKGGTLGFHCAHSYAHTDDRIKRTLPQALKGIDAMIFAVFEGLGLSVNLHAVMEDLQKDYESDSFVASHDLISTGLHGIRISHEGGDDGGPPLTEIVEEAWKSNWRNDIDWFGGPGNQEVAVVHLAYGNQPSAEWHYSTAAILVKVPGKDSKERRALIDETKI